MPGIVSKFENQTIVSFEQNFENMGDLSFAAYFDFETTAVQASQKHLEDKKMYPISYSLIFGFHPKLQLDRTVIFRSFNHSLEQLNGASCLDEMLQNFDPITAIQLKDCTESAFKKRKKNSISEIFSCELKFNCDILKKWFSKKFTRRFLELDAFSKN